MIAEIEKKIEEEKQAQAVTDSKLKPPESEKGTPEKEDKELTDSDKLKDIVKEELESEDVENVTEQSDSEKQDRLLDNLKTTNLELKRKIAEMKSLLNDSYRDQWIRDFRSVQDSIMFTCLYETYFIITIFTLNIGHHNSLPF